MRAVLVNLIAGLAIPVSIVFAGETAIPHVELDFNSMAKGNWAGKRFREIVPPKSINRIVRLADRGFTHGAPTEQQLDYDALVAHLFELNEVAERFEMLAEEGVCADLMITTTQGEIIRIEILSSIAKLAPEGPVPTTILIYGKGQSARIKIVNFKYPDPARRRFPARELIVPPSRTNGKEGFDSLVPTSRLKE